MAFCLHSYLCVVVASLKYRAAVSVMLMIDIAYSMMYNTCTMIGEEAFLWPEIPV